MTLGAAAFLSDFFDNLTVDLDGCELSFRKLRLQPAAAAAATGVGAAAAARPAAAVAPRGVAAGGGELGGELELQLELGVCVRRFPSPFVNF